MPCSKSYETIKEKINYNYILISNILVLDDKYKEIKYDNYNYDIKILFNKWIEQIELDNEPNYNKK